MTWATAVFVSKRGTWIVAQEYDEWIVFELVGDEGSIRFVTKLEEGGTLKAAVKRGFVRRTGGTVDTYIEGRFPSAQVAVQKAKQWSGDEKT